MSDNYPVDKAIERMEQAHAEQQKWLTELRHEMISANQRIAALESSEVCDECVAAAGDMLLESPPPAPDPVCAEFRCVNGYLLEQTRESGVVTAEWVGTTPCPKCNVPTAEPEPAPLDPVESIMRTVVEYANTHAKAERYKREGHEDAERWSDSAGLLRLQVKHSITSYGRDGAR